MSAEHQEHHHCGGICSFNRNSILRYMTRPSHGRHAVGVRDFKDGPRIPLEAARIQRASDTPAPSAATNKISYPKLIPLTASAHSSPAGAPVSEIIVRSMCVASKMLRRLGKSRFHGIPNESDHEVISRRLIGLPILKTINRRLGIG